MVASAPGLILNDYRFRGNPCQSSFRPCINLTMMVNSESLQVLYIKLLWFLYLCYIGTFRLIQTLVKNNCIFICCNQWCSYWLFVELLIGCKNNLRGNFTDDLVLRQQLRKFDIWIKISTFETQSYSLDTLEKRYFNIKQKR